jgi:hypothetical protein
MQPDSIISYLRHSGSLSFFVSTDSGHPGAPMQIPSNLELATLNYALATHPSYVPYRRDGLRSECVVTRICCGRYRRSDRDKSQNGPAFILLILKSCKSWFRQPRAATPIHISYLRHSVCLLFFVSTDSRHPRAPMQLSLNLELATLNYALATHPSDLRYRRDGLP